MINSLVTRKPRMPFQGGHTAMIEGAALHRRDPVRHALELGQYRASASTPPTWLG
jgi:hypothetical protein